MQFGLDYGIANHEGKIGNGEAAAVLAMAWNSGIDTLDTAIAYGDCESRLGELGVRGWRVVSKLPACPERCDDVADWVVKATQGSLARLRTESLYGLLLHQPAQLLESEGEALYRALRAVKERGLVSKIGVSVYEPDELAAILHRFPFDIVQAPFNVLDRRLIDSGWLMRLRRDVTEVHVRSILLQGLLAMDSSARLVQFGRWSALWERWDRWLLDTGLSPLQACVRYALGFPEIEKVIIGVDCARQLQEVLDATSGPIPELPDDLRTTDSQLLNPARWNTHV